MVTDGRLGLLLAAPLQFPVDFLDGHLLVGEHIEELRADVVVEEIHGELQRRGEEKAETTVRHHVNVLQDAGMVEISRLEVAGGGTRKYYRSNTRVFSYDLPEEGGEALAAAQATAADELGTLVETLYAEHGEEIEAVARETKPCEYCETQHYEEFVLRELLDRALIELSETGALEEAFASED